MIEAWAQSFKFLGFFLAPSTGNSAAVRLTQYLNKIVPAAQLPTGSVEERIYEPE